MNSDILNNFIEMMKNADEKQREEITYILSNMNVNNRNNEKVKNFANKIILKENDKKIKYVRFLESSSVNAVIWAPTQVGKSNATREFIESCFKMNVPVIVSTDNKTDQCEQLYSRIEKDLSGADVRMLKVSDKSFSEDLKECIKNEIYRFVIFCLDNSTQIEKLIVNITSLSTRLTEMKKVKKIAIIHDEADQITKDKDTNEINDDQAESHKKWLELVNLINYNMGYMDLKRIFVTATPENCVMLYKIDSPDVIKLEIPSTYVGYKDIQYNQLEDDLDIKNLLIEEVKRIKNDGTNEVILYCIDRKIVDGHERVLNSLASYLKCVINTYNGNGISAYMKNANSSKKFESLLKKEHIQYKKENKIFTIKNMAIRKFYTMCKKIGEKCIVTIGKDLISRGISYVSEDTFEPITATTMIYKPGTTMHAIGIVQTIGRITGCAMPSLKRRLYAPKDVIDTYLSYNKNQESYISNIMKKESESKLTKQVIDEMVFEKFKRHIDRAKLELRMNMKADTQRNTNVNEEDRMKQLIEMWWNANSIIGKILRYIYENENGVEEEDLKTFIKQCGSQDPSKMYSHLTTIGKEYKLIFDRNNNITKLRNEAKSYINKIK